MSKFTQTPPEGGAGRVESIKSLRQDKQGESKRETTTDFIQIVDKPYQTIVLNGRYPVPKFLPNEYVADLVLKLGRRFVEGTELFQGTAAGNQRREAGSDRRYRSGCGDDSVPSQ